TRAFVAVPASGEVTYVWSAGPDEVAMHTVFGREMPGHCSMYIDRAAPRRLSCLRLEKVSDVRRAPDAVIRFSPGLTSAVRRLNWWCAPGFDCPGRGVARVGLFGHAGDDAGLSEGGRHAWELARLISVRLGYLPTAAVAI